MEDSSLWPSRSQVLSLGQDAPSEILRGQIKYLSQIDPNITGNLVEGFCANDDTPIESLKFPDIVSFNGLPDFMSLSRTSDDLYCLNTPIAFKLTVGRFGKNFSSEFLRIRFYTKKYYPIELWDNLNYKSYTLYSKEEFLNCLRDVFNSEECLKKLRFILTGNIV